MKILLIGGGGREHALAWKILQSPLCENLFAIPGSDAIGENGATCFPDIAVGKHADIIAFCKEKHVDLVVIGPEAPLVAGLADDLATAGIAVFGPSKAAARLEGSKGFMKDLCMKYGIPTASYGRFTCPEEAKNFLSQKGLPIVLKADGLAAGKGVIIAQSKDEAERTIDDMLSGNMFGQSGAEIIIEEFMDGEELSVFALCDGKDAVLFASAQDHKAAYDGDKGPNTGGMGAYSPAHMVTVDLETQIMDKMIMPTLKAMAHEGCPFKGVLFAGIMLVKRADGHVYPKLLEYNVRFGDPECQVIMKRLKSDIVPLLQASAEGNLKDVLAQQKIQWDSRPALCVVMAANGYPGSYEQDTILRLPAKTDIDKDSVIFHAGTKKALTSALGEDLYLSTGGRVLSCTASGKDFARAQEKAYELVSQIDWRQGFCRTDIGYRAMA